LPQDGILGGVRLCEVVALLALLASTGCGHTNYFQKNYLDARPQPGRYVPPIERATADADCREGQNLHLESRRMLEDGYVVVGSSDFVCTDCYFYRPDLQQVAQSNGAAAVIVYSRQVGKTVQHWTEEVMIGIGSDSTEGTSSTVCQGGECTTESTPGTVTWHPIVEKREHDDYHFKEAHLALFWAKAKPDPLGVFARNLTAKEAATLEIRGGVLVYAVVRGSPAAAAGLARGDVLTAVGDSAVDAASLRAQILTLAGRRATLRGYHRRRPFTIEVPLGQAPADPAPAPSAP
jgi:hypothetical protein